jgi:hypothetical protein
MSSQERNNVASRVKTTEVLQNVDIVSEIFEFLTKEKIKILVELSEEGDRFLLGSFMGAYSNWLDQRIAHFSHTGVLWKAIKCQDHAISVFLLESTVFDNISEYLTGDDILNLKKTNMVTHYIKKNALRKQICKQMDTWLYHHRKDVEYRNEEQ